MKKNKNIYSDDDGFPYGDYLFEGYNADSSDNSVDEPYDPPFPDNPFEDDELRRIYCDYYGIEEDAFDNPFNPFDYFNDIDEFYAICDAYGIPPEEFTIRDYISWCEGYYDDSFFLSSYYGGEWEELASSYFGAVTGKEKPEHSIKNPVDIKTQKGPRCSAYAASCYLRYKGKESKPKALYNKFLKLPDGSAIPSSVGRKTGLKCVRNGNIDDIKKLIDQDIPALVLIHYSPKDLDFDSLHYVLVTGYDDSNFYIADSLFSKGELYYNRVVSHDNFIKMWDTSNNFLVRVFYGKNIMYKPEDNISREG